jgi:tetratricopeptide (TPR) repeat protein
MVNTGDNLDKVLTSTGEISLPTYELLGENRNPVFRSQYGVAHIYPYTLQDEIASSPTEITYITLYLENKYLRVTVLPGLGGRVFSVYDKTSQREVFYKNSTIKFSPLAIRGAFFSGGVEFSFPVAHAPTTTDSVNWDIFENEDGSASIIIGGLEHMSNMRWTIKLTLFPERCALAQDVQLYNPSPIPGRYHYWTNASLHSDDQTEFIYPFQRVRSYEFAGTASWPVTRLDLITSEPGLPGMEGVPMWPAERLHEPFNFRWEKDMLAQVSIFGRNVEWDYFGAWQHSTNTGYAHFARSEDVSGMKLWSWGRGDVGIVNQSALMDDGSLYAETQCGAMETQLDFDFLPPGVTRMWREWWLPFRQLGGLTCSSSEIGARLHLAPGNEDTQVNLTLGICPVYPIEEARIVLSIPEQTLLEESISGSPEQPWVKTIQVESQTLGGQPLRLTVTDVNNSTMIDYTHEREAHSFDISSSDSKSPPQSADDYYQIGLDYENFDNRAQALESYRQALRLADEYGPVHFQLGLMLLRSADFKAARDHFQYAVDLGINDAHYYLGLINRYQGDVEQAEGHFRATQTASPLSSAASLCLASLALLKDQWLQAVELLKNANPAPDDSASIETLLALALNRAGKKAEAFAQFEHLLQKDPLNLIILRELASLDDHSDRDYRAKLDRLLRDDRQYILDLACFYLDWGLPLDALSILEQEIANWDYPMLYYLAGYLDQQLGNQEKAIRWRDNAQDASADMVFPSRLWEVIALNQALEQNPEDFKAKYYLGNFLYAHQRFTEAVDLWEQAVDGLAEFDIIHRNLGLAYWHWKDDPARAITYFEKALTLNPNNQDLYLHLDDLYLLGDLPEKRAELLEAMAALDPIREELRKRSLAILVDLGKYNQALEIITSEEFVPLEMDQSFHLVYVKALLGNAEEQMESGQISEAILTYRKALEFPKNQGVGKPTTSSNAEIYYRLGCAYEMLGKYRPAIEAWQEAAREHHPIGEDLFTYVQMSLDKLGRYSELGFPVH